MGMSKAGKYRIIVIIFLLPLFIINIKDSHDWGDDFAQYLIQAKNIIEKKPQSDNGLILNENNHIYAIQAYPIGFPILLAPVYFFFKLHIQPYMFLLSAFLFVAGIFCFEFFRKQTDLFLALLITLLFCYNPATLYLKKQILSEIPFTCFLMAALFWPYSKYFSKKYSWIVTGILFAFLISIRLAGITALIAFILFELNRILRNKNEDIKHSMLKLTFSMITVTIVVYLLNVVFFSIKPVSLLGFYSSAFIENEIRMGANFEYYYSVLKYILPFFGTWIPAFWLIIAFIGWFIRLLKFRTLSEYFFPVYIILIIFYPYTQGGNRFIIPILPLLFFYLYYFFNWLFYWFGKRPYNVSVAILLILLLAYVGPLMGLGADQSSTEDGPQKKTAIELFEYLKTTPKNTPIVFCRARAMALYSGHPTLYFTKEQNDDDAFSEFKAFEKLLIVISKNPNSHVTDKRLGNYLARYDKDYNRIWENEEYQVYEQKIIGT